MPGELSIVIISYNSADRIGPLLDSIPAAAEDLPVRTVVVDNGSTDGTLDLLRQRPDVELVESTNVGYAAGFNKGVARHPDSDYLMVLNPDTRLTPGCLAPLVRALQVGGVGIAVPRVVDEDGRLQHSLRREPTIPRAAGLNFTGLAAFAEYVNREEAYRLPCVVDWALGAVMLLRRDCYEALGGWDESYFLYAEETDFCLRARDRGWATMYIPESEVMHVGGGSGRNDTTHVMQIVNRVRVYARRHSTPAGYAYWAATVLSEASWWARGHSNARASLRALLRPSTRPAQLEAPSVLPR